MNVFFLVYVSKRFGKIIYNYWTRLINYLPLLSASIIDQLFVASQINHLPLPSASARNDLLVTDKSSSIIVLSFTYSFSKFCGCHEVQQICTIISQTIICTSYVQLTYYCHQLFEGKLANQR